MNFKGGSFWIVALIVTLLVAVLMTILAGGERSRHGYGASGPPPVQGGPLSTG